MNANNKSKEKHSKNKNEKKQTSKDDLNKEVDDNNSKSVIYHYNVLGHYFLGHYVADNFIRNKTMLTSNTYITANDSKPKTIEGMEVTK